VNDVAVFFELFEQSMEQHPIRTVVGQAETMHDSNRHVGPSKMIAEIGDERLAFSG